VRVLVFYAVRELLFNVVKHSGTLEATVNFESKETYLNVIVSDSGKGFAMELLSSRQHMGHGIESLLHRLDLLGCSMKVQSGLGQGTQVTIEVPYERTVDSA
jgi:signal transduction histidine kinase